MRDPLLLADLPNWLFLLVSDPEDPYSNNHGFVGDEVQGVYALGHIDKDLLAAEVLKACPNTVVDLCHYGWRARYLTVGYTNDEAHTIRLKPTGELVCHTWWIGRNRLRLSRAGKRGAYPVTYLPLQAEGWVEHPLYHIWDGQRYRAHIDHAIFWRRCGWRTCGVCQPT